MRCLYTSFTHILQNSIPASQHTILSLVHYNEVLYLITDPLWHACHFIFRMRDTFYDYKWCIYEPNLSLSLNIKNRLYIKHRRKTVLYSVKISLFVTNYRHNLFKPSYVSSCGACWTHSFVINGEWVVNICSLWLVSFSLAYCTHRLIIRKSFRCV